MFNKFKYLISVLIIVSLFLPQPASAIFGTGVFDVFDHMLHGISEKTGPMAALMIVLLFFYLVLLLLLWVSGLILEVFIVKQVSWIAALQGMTEVGWNFTAGIANLFLIIIFLVIAFAFIFKIETFQAKKSLPRLIIVAILLNFSLLFVNVLTDMSHIAYNTVLEAMPDGLIARVTTVLVMPLLFTVVALMALITTAIIAWSIPIASAFAQILFAAIFIPFILPFLAVLGIQMLLFAPVAVMFVTYVFLFGARVFVLQILAMLAPLAFICLILPQTKKYWDEWFQHLVQWLLLGVVVLFLLALGFSALDYLRIPPGSIMDCFGVPGPLLPICFFLEAIVILGIFYFGVFVYLMAVLFISRKLMPTFATFLIDQAKAMAGNMVNMGLKPFAAGAAFHWKKGLTESKWVQDKAARESTLKTPELRGIRKMLAPGYAIRRSVGQALGPGLLEARHKEILANEKKLAAIETPGMLESKYVAARSDEERATILSVAANKGGPFKEALIQDENGNFLNTKEAIRAARRANKIGLKPQAKAIARAYIDEKLTEPEQTARLVAMGFKRKKDLSQKEQKEWNDKGYKTPMEKLIAEAKGDEIKQFSDGFWKSPAAMNAINKFWTGGQISQAANEFGRLFINDFQVQANQKGIEWYQDPNNNPRLARYLSSSAAHGLGLETPPKTVIPTKTWTPPPPKPKPPTEKDITMQEIIKKDLQGYRREYEKLLRKPEGTRTQEEEETIKMLESTIEDLKKRLNP